MIPSIPAVLALFLAASPTTHALQTVSARDGETVFAMIAQKEVTRIGVESGRIQRITGNAGEFTLEKDDERGQVFLRPADPSSTKPINLFVTTDRGTLGLLLQPVDAPSDTILIRDRREARAPSTGAARHVQNLKNFVLAVATDTPEYRMDVRTSGFELGFLPGLRLTQVRSFVADHEVGEHYVVVNETAAARRLAPSDFFKPGVMAVAITQPELPAGYGTEVFVIRERHAHE